MTTSTMGSSTSAGGSVAFLRAVVSNIAIRDEVGSTDRVGDYAKGDAIKLVSPLAAGAAVEEWVAVSLVGAVRAPVEEGVERAEVGFVRTRNRVATLLEPWVPGTVVEGETAEARHAAQRDARDAGTSWFTSATRTSATAAQHAQPLLKGGRDEYERRQKIFAAADRIAGDAKASENKVMDVETLRSRLEETFEGADWLAPLIHGAKLLHILTMVTKDNVRKEAAVPSEPQHHQPNTNIPPPPATRGLSVLTEEDAVLVQPPPSPAVVHTASSIDEAPVVVAAAAFSSSSSSSNNEPGTGRAVDLGSSTQGAFGSLTSLDAFAELWCRLPWASRAVIAACSKATCAAVRSVPWRRACGAVADEAGILCLELHCDAWPLRPRSDEAWRLLFVDLWRGRRFGTWGNAAASHKKRRASVDKDAFKIGAVVRFRPRKEDSSEEDDDDSGGLFLPLHQRLQLQKLGHDTGLSDEVHDRLGTVDEDVETYAARQERRKREARRNTERLVREKALTPAAPSSLSRGDENAHHNIMMHGDSDKNACAPAPAPSSVVVGGVEEGPAVVQEEAVEEQQHHRHHDQAKVQAKVVSTEARRVLVGLPSSGLVYMDFDAVIDGASDQVATYARAAAPLVAALCLGRNGCLLAYGQTGSGKSHTMFGGPGVLDDAAAAPTVHISKAAGVVPRVLSDVLAACVSFQKTATTVDCTVTFSYLELYAEMLTDLLTGEAVRMYRVGEGAAADEYRAKSGSTVPVLFKGATVFDASDKGVEAAFGALAEAEHRKRRAATAMNARSSRGHTVFALSLTQRRGGQLKTSRLFLCDLGGSEQTKRSKAAGDRFREAVEINASLSALGRVVDALLTGAAHVPYYESPLTMLLQPAFGGDSQTTVLVAASPDTLDGDETLASLRFGTRCAQVRNAVNDVTADMGDVLKSLAAKIAASEREVARLEVQGAHTRARAELDNPLLRGMGAGHAAASRLRAMDHQDDTGGDVTKEAGLSTAQAHATRGEYSFVEDDAGLWLIETQKLGDLRKRQASILGAANNKTTSTTVK